MRLITLKCREPHKAVFDARRRRFGNPPQHSFIGALLHGWDALTPSQQQRALEAASRVDSEPSVDVDPDASVAGTSQSDT